MLRRLPFRPPRSLPQDQPTAIFDGKPVGLVEWKVYEMGGYLPLYEYQCRQCGERIEKIQKFSAPVLTKCAKCGCGMERLLSAPAIQFKGSGWYVTDYARKSPAGETPTTEGASTKSEKKDSGTSTPAETAPPKPSPEK